MNCVLDMVELRDMMRIISFIKDAAVMSIRIILQVSTICTRFRQGQNMLPECFQRTSAFITNAGSLFHSI